MQKVVRIVFLLFLFYKGILSSDCVRRKYEFSSFVCVCNEEQCNFAGDSNVKIDESNVKVVKTSRDEFRNSEEVLPRQDETSNNSNAEFSININPNDKRQKVIGFGGAFTDASSINIKSLSKKAQDNFMKMYFSKEGSRYNLVRVPIAGTDYSTHPYSYDDIEGDVDLAHFNLTVEDYEYKLPLIKEAIGLSTDDLYILATPWSSPAWMKTNGMFNGSGELLPEMWQPFSNYLVKFFQMYEENLGIELWGLTAGNEPLVTYEPGFPWNNNLGWTGEKMRDWIKTNLGPTLSDAGYRRLKLLIFDHNRDNLVSFVEPILKDPTAKEYVDGIAVHWYKDLEVGPDVLDEAHKIDDSKFILYTEACVENASYPVALGSWERGERYITNIIEDLNHWSTGWIDWNLAINPEGGPDWAKPKGLFDSSAIINATANEFYLEPMYFALSHFSRNIERGATWISSSLEPTTNDLKVTAFENPNGQIVAVMANIAESPHQIRIANENKETIFNYNIEGKTWLTITYQG